MTGVRFLGKEDEGVGGGNRREGLKGKGGRVCFGSGGGKVVGAEGSERA